MKERLGRRSFWGRVIVAASLCAALLLSAGAALAGGGGGGKKVCLLGTNVCGPVPDQKPIIEMIQKVIDELPPP
jgi:hypothetical protein